MPQRRNWNSSTSGVEAGCVTGNILLEQCPAVSSGVPAVLANPDETDGTIEGGDSGKILLQVVSMVSVFMVTPYGLVNHLDHEDRESTRTAKLLSYVRLENFQPFLLISENSPGKAIASR